MQPIVPVSAFNDNYIWVWNEGSSNQAVVVDPGDAAPVIAYLEKQGLTLHAILITHHHNDHTGGIDDLLALATKHGWQVPVFGPKNSRITQITDALSEGESIQIFDQRVEVINLPGHTLDHIGFYCADQEALFCGDTLFRAGCGRLFEGSPEQMFQSLARLMELPADTKVFAAHEYTLSNLAFAQAAEPENLAVKAAVEHDKAKRENNMPTLPSTLSQEREINPFLRTTSPSLITTVQQEAERLGNMDHLPSTAVEVFAFLREWKNRF
ncbi:hydroxyacylglutathione hydrolase [Pokkaliibacter sp. CJK22405]|uniref:hydroxyacylglutathione hydrolase n=1 Tax=Pokkaliibacter sp. CJK22405 TaxID=3384615 RepID=UPI003984B9B9